MKQEIFIPRPGTEGNRLSNLEPVLWIRNYFFFSDPDPALGLISDPDPDPACLTKVIRLYKIKL